MNGSAGIYAFTFTLLLTVAGPVAAQDWVPYPDAVASGHSVSPDVRSLPEAPGRVSQIVEVPIQHRPSFVPGGPGAPDSVLQQTPGSTLSTTQGAGFDGVSFNGYYPPDPNISVSDTQIVQTTNVLLAVYDKTGALLKGPVSLSSLFANLGGLCGSINGGDPVVLWDKIAKRWMISQIAYTNNFRQDAVCIAVSQTTDATGAFNLYSFGFSRLPDYPKFGVWSSSAVSGGSDYFLSANLFSTAFYYGPVVCAFNGADMQTGVTARFACAQGSTSNFSLLPSDLDGGAAPAMGEANYFLELGTGISSTSSNKLIMFPFKATWTASGGSLNNPTAVQITTAQYALACSNGGTCIPQAGTTQTVDSLGDRLMYRLAFRKFAGYESLLVNHAVDEGNGIVGIRWYEIRSGNGTLASSASVYQQGTFSGLDGDYRWMASIAQDRSANIAMGYSRSSASIFPSIWYTGRNAGDPTGTMGIEGQLIAGSASETGASRWGDYTSLSLDPVDDCTFWYTNEYFVPNSSSSVAWSTRIASFQFSTCGSVTKTSTTTGLQSSPNPSTYGASVTLTATVTAAAGTPSGTVTFDDGGTPLGSATLDGSGQAAFSTSALAAGSHSVTASYNGNSSYSTSTSSPVSQTVHQASTATSVSSSVNPSNSGQSVTFTATVTPSAATGSVEFFDGATSLGVVGLSGGTAQLATSSLSAGSHSMTAVYGGDSNYVGGTSNTATQTVNPPSQGSFSLTPSPSSATVSQSGTTSLTITVTPSGGFASDVTLAASGVPPQSSASFIPNPVAGGSGSSTLTVTIGRNTPRKNYTVTITGTGGGLSATTTVAITVQ